MIPKISVVIPALNEAEGIGRVVALCREFAHEIIVVDGGSTDNTASIAYMAGASVIIERQRGYGLALLTGFKAATGDVIATCDADGTYPVHMIPGMVNHLYRAGLMFLSGCRFPIAFKESMTFRNRVGNRILSLIGSVLFGHRFKDILSGMWVFRREALNDVSLYSTKWDLSQEIKIEFQRKFHGFAELKIPYSVRHGVSKLYPWRVGFENLCYFFIHRFGVRHWFYPRFRTSDTEDWNDEWTKIGESSDAGPTPRYRARIIEKELKLECGDRLLNIGCGTGSLESVLASKSLAKFYGVDTSETAIEIAQLTHFQGEGRVTFQQMDVSCFADREMLRLFYATHCVVSEVIEHLDDPLTFLNNVAETLPRGAVVVLTVPGGPMNEFYLRIGHRRHYTPTELRKLVLQTGKFEVCRAYGCGWPFFNLFRILLTVFGDRVNTMVDRRPGLFTKLVLKAFDLLFRLNLPGVGWQTVVVGIRNREE